MTAAGAGDLEEAQRAYDEGRYHDARAAACRALEAAPEDPEVLGLAGRIELELGAYDEALEHLGRAAAGDPEGWEEERRDAAAQVAFFYGRDDEARALLAGADGDDPVGREMAFLLSPPGLVRVRSRAGHYLVYADADLAARDGHRYAATLMDIVYDAYAKVFPFERDEEVVYRLYAFGRTDGYAAFNEGRGRDMTGAVGYYAPSTRILVVNADPRGASVNEQGFSADAVDTLFHEGMHQFVDMYARDVPAWFDEGLAEYFGPSELAGRRSLRVGVVRKTDPAGRWTRYARIREAVEKGEPLAPLPLAEFLLQDDEAFHASDKRESLNYAQAWSLVHFLLHSPSMGPRGAQLVKTYFKALAAGRGREAAHAETFGRLDLGRIEAAWRDYVMRL